MCVLLRSACTYVYMCVYVCICSIIIDIALIYHRLSRENQTSGSDQLWKAREEGQSEKKLGVVTTESPSPSSRLDLDQCRLAVPSVETG